MRIVENVKKIGSKHFGIPTAKHGRLKRVLIYGLAGAVIGYIALHPLSMLVHYRYYYPETEWLDFLADSFSGQHLVMAFYFVALGALAGMIQGLYIHRLKVLYERARALSITDELTSLYNRRHFLNELEREVERAKRYSESFCLAIVDIDNFKHYNDTHGHQMGDELLKEFAGFVRTVVRETDMVGRYGGDEFIILMPETTRAVAYHVAERLRSRVQEYPFHGRETQPGGNVTISIGVAEFATDGESSHQLLRSADNALYEAKRDGRNMVCLANRYRLDPESSGCRAV